MKYLIAVSLLFTGCASLKSEVFHKVHKGDSEAYLFETLGEPNQQGPSKDGTGQEYYYARRGDLCGFFVKNGIVEEVGCWNRPGYVNPAAAMLQGMGTAMSQPSSPPVRVQQVQNYPTQCNSYTIGNQTQTNCF